MVARVNWTRMLLVRALTVFTIQCGPVYALLLRSKVTATTCYPTMGYEDHTEIL